MLTAYERRLLAFYLANAASRLHYRDYEASNLAEWAADRANGASTFGIAGQCLRASNMNPDTEQGMSARKWRDLQRALRDEHEATRKARHDRTAQRLRRLGRAMCLTRTDIDILELLLRYQTQPVIEAMIDHVFGVPRHLPITPLNVRGAALTSFLGVSAGTVHGRLREDARLVQSGLVSVGCDGDVNVVSRLRRLATAPGGVGLDVNRLLIDAASPSELEWSDFDHVARERDHVESLLQGALETGATGVNVLLYGPPGTGKTEFCKVLAERLGVTLYGVGESADNGEEPSRHQRLQELRLSQRLLARERRSLVLFDEMEDLLSEPFADFALFGRPSGARLRDAVEAVFGPLEIVARGDNRRHWRLRSDALRRLVSVSAEELAQITSAAEALERAGFGSYASGLLDLATKLRATLRTESLARLESDLEALVLAEGLAMRPGPRSHLDPDLLALLREAILTCRVVEFRYLAQSTARSSRQRVRPYGLLYGNRAFLVATADWSDEPRLWRLSNVSEARLSDESFERDTEFDLQRYAKRSFGTFQEEPVEVVLRFDAAAARDASAFLFHPVQSVEENGDGSVTVQFKAGGVDEMCWHLFTWGESVTVEKPARLRRRLAEMCAVRAEHHGGTQ